ncbi:hypothetical protein D4764_14G0000280, partial [Takifugu flavidus]
VDTSNNGPRNWEPNKPVFKSIPFRLSRKTEDRQESQGERGEEGKREGRGEEKEKEKEREEERRGEERRGEETMTQMDEDRAESTVPSCVSLKSDRSKDGGIIDFRSSEEM